MINVCTMYGKQSLVVLLFVVYISPVSHAFISSCDNGLDESGSVLLILVIVEGVACVILLSVLVYLVRNPYMPKGAIKKNETKRPTNTEPDRNSRIYLDLQRERNIYDNMEMQYEVLKPTDRTSTTENKSIAGNETMCKTTEVLK